jgi:hypothetical protein
VGRVPARDLPPSLQSAPVQTPAPPADGLTVNMRRFVLAASLLTFAGGALIYGPSDDTERWFAWDIEPPLTAAFLGANFWATSLAALLAVRQGSWERVRLVIPAVGVLMPFTLAATLMHLDRFDFRSGFGWSWLVAYGLFPAFLAPILAEQRLAWERPPERRPFSFPMALALSLLGFGLLAEGTALFLDPAAAARFWPWPLTPLTSRAVAAWLLAFGLAALHASWERDWLPYWPIAVTYTAFGVLQLLALARWGEVVDWDEVAGWIYVGGVVAMLVLGALGVRAVGRRPRRPTGAAAAPAEPPPPEPAPRGTS